MRAPSRPSGTWKPATIAFAAAQRREGIEAAAVLQVDEAARPRGLFAQQRDGEIMARVHHQRWRRLGERLVQRAGELGGEVVELGREARLRALAGPEQALAERGELRAAPLLLGDERRAEELLPLRDQVPRMR
jgi:hypothetical protein